MGYRSDKRKSLQAQISEDMKEWIDKFVREDPEFVNNTELVISALSKWFNDERPGVAREFKKLLSEYRNASHEARRKPRKRASSKMSSRARKIVSDAISGHKPTTP